MAATSRGHDEVGVVRISLTVDGRACPGHPRLSCWITHASRKSASAALRTQNFASRVNPRCAGDDKTTLRVMTGLHFRIFSSSDAAAVAERPAAPAASRRRHRSGRSCRPGSQDADRPAPGLSSWARRAGSAVRFASAANWAAFARYSSVTNPRRSPPSVRLFDPTVGGRAGSGQRKFFSAGMELFQRGRSDVLTRVTIGSKASFSACGYSR